MKRLTRGGLPIDGADWTEEDWQDLHDAVEGIKRRVAARHRGEAVNELLTANEARARVVGNAVYLEHIGMSGDIASWGMGSKEAAEDVAGAINGLLNELRHWLADGAQKAGEYAHKTTKDRERLEAFISRLLNPEELGMAVPAHVRDAARRVLGMQPVEGY